MRAKIGERTGMCNVGRERYVCVSRVNEGDGKSTGADASTTGKKKSPLKGAFLRGSRVQLSVMQGVARVA
jgi:hypothetical protein